MRNQQAPSETTLPKGTERRSLTDEERGALDELYERFGRPLEAEHWGEYVAISASGETLLGTDLLELGLRSREVMEPGGAVFKVGEIAVGNVP